MHKVNRVRRIFRIARNEIYDEYGTLIRKFWIVQQKKKFLWWGYWQTFQYLSGYDDYNSLLIFESEESARSFIVDILIPNKPHNECVEIITDQIEITTPEY